MILSQKRGKFGTKLPANKKMKSVACEIEENIKKKEKGSIIFTSDYPQFDSENTGKILARLCNKGLIVRISSGIYLYPQISELTGRIIYPDTEEIAKAIAKKEKSRIAPTGEYALFSLGLTTQVPVKVVFLTDGSDRTIKIGKRTIEFRNTIAKNLSFQNEMVMQIVYAIKAIGQNITPEQIDSIGKFLKPIDKKEILQDIQLAPEWIRKVLKKALID